MKKIMESKKAKGTGPYASMAEAGNLVFVSGQIPIDYVSGKVLADNAGNSTRQVMENLKMLLKENNYNLSDVIKTTIYLTDNSEEEEILNVYKSYFNGIYPVCTIVGAAFLPRGAKIQIDAVATR